MSREAAAALPPERLLETLRAIGAAPVWWTGETLARHLCGVWSPADGFTLVSEMPAAALLARLPRAVVTDAEAGRLTLPSPAGPIDLHPAREIEPLLASEPFGPLALAWDPATDRWLDPYAARDALEQRRLSMTGPPAALLSADPVRGPRALRLCAQLGLSPDAALRDALPKLRVDLLSSRRLGRELRPLLCAPRPSEALRELSRTGWVGPGPERLRDDLGEVLAALPEDDLELRLAAWLRDGPVGASLRRLSVGAPRAQRVQRLLDHHPLESHARPEHAPAVASLRRRLGPGVLSRVLALREAEARAGDAESERVVARFRETLAAVEAEARRQALQRSLAVRGSDVMDWLSLPAGPAVGRALRFLSEHVRDHPEDNDRDTLRAQLTRWIAEEN